MYKTLFKHYLLKGFRSPGYYKNLIVNIFMGLTVLYFVVIFVMLGFLLPNILGDIAPQQNPAEIFNGILLYAVLTMLFFRYIIQTLSTLNIEYYQVLPIKRGTLVNYLLLKPLLNPINYISLCLVIPFSITGISPVYGAGGTFRFLFIVIFLIWFNTLLAPLLKRQFNNLFLGSVVLLAILGGLGALEYFKIFSLISLSQPFFDIMTKSSWLWVSMLIPVVLVFALNKSYFAKNYYPEKFNKRSKKIDASSGKFTFIERFGKIGELISLEIKLALRHKRTKNTFYMSFIFLLYGLLFYPNEMYNNNPGWLILVAIFVTGIGMVSFGQWIINWDGAHFDFLMTRDIDSKTYIKAYYWFLLALSIISFILTTPYFLFGWKIIIYHLVALLYNAGINIYVYLFGATFNTKRLELAKGSSMNMQGVSYKNFILLAPLLVIPIMLVNIFNLFEATHIALFILALLGLTGILFRGPLLRIIEKQFLRRKYALCTGFRKKG